MAQQDPKSSTAQPAKENPPTGSFPGFQRGSRFFSAWSKTLLAHAGVWDGVWSKLKDGSYEMKDWYKALTQSVDIAATSLDELMQIVAGGPPAPPWASLSWPPTEVQSVRPRLQVDGTHVLPPFKLCRLGAASTNSLQGHANWDGSAVVVSLDWPAEDPESGDYIGFIFSTRYAEPLAVITLRVPTKSRSAEVPT